MREITVGTRELKNRLSKYLRLVMAGGIIIITDRGKPIGQILPIQVDLNSRRTNFEKAGVVDWNRQPVPQYQPKGVSRSEYLLSDPVAGGRE